MGTLFQLLLFMRPSAEAFGKIGTYGSALLLFIIWFFEQADHRKICRPKSIVIIERLFIAYICALTLTSVANGTGFDIVVKNIVLLCVIDVTCLLVVKNKIKSSSLPKLVIMSALPPLAFGLVQLITGGGGYDFEVGARRINSFFVVSSQYGIYLMIVSSVAFYLATRRETVRRAYYWAAFLLSTYELLFTYTRIAWLGLILIISSLLLIMLFKGEISVQLFALIATAALLALCISWDTISSRLFSSQAGNSMDTRSYIWSTMLRMVPSRLLLGYGPDSTVDYIGLHAHNEYLKTIFEYGVTGAFIFWLLQLISIIQLYRQSKQSKNCRFCALVFICLLIVSLTDNIYDSLVFQFFVWSMTASSLSSYMTVSDEGGMQGQLLAKYNNLNGEI